MDNVAIARREYGVAEKDLVASNQPPSDDPLSLANSTDANIIVCATCFH